MPPIDAGIYSQVRQQVAPDLLGNYAQAMQIQGGMQQNRLMEMKMQEAQREQAEAMAEREAVKGFGTDATANYNRLLQTGNLKSATSYKKANTDQRKADNEARKAEIEGGLQKFQAIGQIMNGVRDQATYDIARQNMAEVVGPEAAANLPPQFDPQRITQARQQALSVKEQLEQEWKAMEYTTPKADARLSSETSRRGQDMTDARTRSEGAANRGVTLQGQTMADARAREFNATKVEENNIKRTDKKDVADLTKNSQIASFDTMLGTLDRLAVHPGLSRSVGVTGALPTMPGSNSANFQAELNTFQSQAFLPMVAQLKGMGALSDAEGKKLTAAVGALDPKMGEVAFRDSVARITEDMETARARMAGSRRTPNTGGVTGTFDAKASALKPAEQAELKALRERFKK